MAYIGAQPNKQLTKTTSQSFNGTGSATAFTLNRTVNTGEELEVFVDNVQQEPGSGKSYTATGTTLTFDEAPPLGTGNVYVIYRGQAEVTTRLEAPDLSITTAKLAADAVTTAKITDANITTAKIADDAVTAAKISSLPAGSILQVVSTTKTDAFTATTGTASSPLDVTGLSLNITPTSTSSKILVRASLNYGGVNNIYGLFFFKRGSTDLTISTYGTGSQLNAAVGVHGDNSNFQHGLQSATFEFLDSPSSTSQLTYKVQMASRNGSTEFYLNRPHNTDNASYIIGGTSTFTLMEIAG